MSRKRRMDAYYYGFDATGADDIDRLLSAVACAGKAFHHTEEWQHHAAEPYEPEHRGATVVEWIQNAAADAAQRIAELERSLSASQERERVLSDALVKVEAEGLEAAKALLVLSREAEDREIDPEDVTAALGHCNQVVMDARAALQSPPTPAPESEREKRLAEALSGLMASIGGGKKGCGHDYSCVCAWDLARAALSKSQEGRHD